MLSGSPLAVVSAFLTYFIQTTFAYLAASLACALIRSPRIRLRAWAAVLLFAVARWMVFCASTTIAVSPSAFVSHMPNAPTLDWSWPVMGSWAPYLASLAVWGGRLYVAVLAISLLQLLWTWLCLQSLLYSGDNPSPELDALFQDLCSKMKIRRCRLTLVADLPSPATAGWWLPQVLLPAEVVPQLSSIELTHILHHELTHVRRRDYLWDLLASFACRLVFFHPVAWLACRKIRWERELSCDQAVTQDSPEVRLQYAQCLAKLARWWHAGATHSRQGVCLAAAPSLLATRVRVLLSAPSASSIYARLSRACLSSAVALLSACLLPAVGLTLYWSAPLLSLSTQLRSASPETRTRSARKTSLPHTHPSMPEGAATRLQVTTPEAVSSILTGLSAKPLPTLTTSSASEPSAMNPKDTLPASGSESAGAWHESPVPLATGPNWQKLATDAATGAIGSIGHAGGDTQDGQSGQQGNH